MVSVGKYTMDGSYGILKGQMDSSTTNGILKDSSTTKEPFAFGRLPCHSQIVRHAFDHHLMFREKRLRGQPLPSGARNLEDTGARTKSPLSGAGHPRNRKSKPHRWESATLVTSRWKKSVRRKVVFFVWKVEAGFCAILRFCLSKKCHNWCKHGRIW